jgi:hypothetical protein
LTTEALALHVEPIERYNGETIGSDPFGPRLVFENRAYLRTGGTFTARMDEWDGELYAIQRIRAAITELEEVDVLELPVISGTSTTVGVSPNDFEVGRVAGMNVDSANQALGPFQKVSTGGKVLGTLDVQQKITAEQNLEVIGTSTLSNTNIGGAANFNGTASVNGGWYAAIEDVTATASGTYEVTATDYILFVTWSGDTGTFSIALPPVESSEGRMIRVKTDSTISNSNAISIVPDAGDTGVVIDGESSSSMTRSYDGATYLCHSSEWWVIQKKDKG